MSARTVARTRRQTVLSAFASILLSVASAAPPAWIPSAAAAGGLADFGTPTAKSSFTGGIDFNQPVTIARPLSRVELLLTIGDAVGQTVIPVATPDGTGPSTLSYHLNQDVDGHLYPGTRFTARWRLTAGDGPSDVAIGPRRDLQFVDDRFDWQTAAGSLITVHWYNGPKSFGQRALRIGEDGVRQAATLLGVTESDPIDFYIYADHDAFYDALGPGTHENVGGSYIPGTRLMFALIPPDQISDAWVGVVIPHELTHLVFQTAVNNPYHFPPNWLNEGLAVYLSQGYDPSDRSAVESAAGSGSLIPLDGLTGQFPTSYDRFSLAYAESVSAIDYLIRTHGKEPLVSLIRSYARGHTDDEAFEAALGVDATAFGTAWLEDLGASPPTRYGPQPAPPGPMPSAWLGEAGASAAPAPSGATAAIPGASPAANGASGGGMAGLIVVMVLLVVGLVGVALVVRRRQTRPGPPG